MNAILKNLLLKIFAMNESDLEKMLADLAPMPVSERLESLVERDLRIDSGLRVIDGGLPSMVKTVKPRMPWWQPVVWASLGAAAAIVITGMTPKQSGARATNLASNAPASNEAVSPINSTREWLNADDQGVQFNSEKLPERHLKLVSVERHEWVDPRDGAQIAVEIPREDTVVLPVEFQ